MDAVRGMTATMTGEDKAPRTERGRRTLRALLDAAASEFGEKGFHESSIVSITSRAGVALGSFYTYFDSKESLFRALVRDMSRQVGEVGARAVRDAKGTLAGEHAVLEAFITFARDHTELYRIIDESEFVDPESYHAHYENAATRIRARLEAGVAKGELRPVVSDVHAWALMGINVFLGLRYGVRSNDRDPAEIADIVADMLANGLRR
jgi:AcrR family transcriptional regulator